MIKRLRVDADRVTQDMKDMEALATNFFKNLYTADDEVQSEEVIHLFQPMITKEMNKGLCKNFSMEEISDALFQIGPLKAPGPDGFPVRFFQRNWEALREDLTRVVQQFFVSGVMPVGVNDTTIVLLPKKDEPENLKNF
jgi:hypothetical protein